MNDQFMDSLSWGLGFSGVIFVGLTVAVVLYIIEICNEPVRKLKRQERTYRKSAESDSKFLKSINLDGMRIVEFAALYNERTKNNLLVKEFNAALNRYRPRDIAEKAQMKLNEGKNVFENHLPFEYNLVDIGTMKHHYINASWVPGPSSDQMYIITQVPLKTTVMDFWRMIWTYNCNVVVMLGKEIIDDQIIFDYLNPANYDKLNSPFHIDIKETTIFSEYLKRIIILHLKGDTKEIVHLQFTTWTHDSDTYPHTILELRRHMKIERLKHSGPVIVHCISGCGRSGAFVAIANMCERIDELKESRNDDRISIAHEVIRLRESRMLSVANIHQYQIVYETVLHYIVGGVTVIPMAKLEKEMQFLSVKSAVNGQTRFHRQFLNTKSLTRSLYTADCAGGLRPENQYKNRRIDVVPRDCDRPYLKNTFDENSTDYINAVSIDSFNCRGHFIVTQWPMRSTINDIWRLFYDKTVNAVIVLEALDNSKEYPKFWPNILNQSVGFGTIAVQLIKEFMIASSIRCQVFQINKLEYVLKESEMSDLKSTNVRVVNKTSARRRETREITIFHLMNWNSKKDVPDNLENLIDIVCLAEEFNNLSSNYNKGETPPIVVMSKDGITRVGVVCVLSICLGNIRFNYEVDVYGAVINVKRNRPQLLPTLAEYLLCYELCLEQLALSKRQPEENEGEDNIEQLEKQIEETEIEKNEDIIE